MLLTVLSHFGHIHIERFFFSGVVKALFPQATGFVGECLMSVGIILDDNITHQQLFELAIDVKCRDRDRGNSVSEFRENCHFDGIPIP